jgi:hypothetical protein
MNERARHLVNRLHHKRDATLAFFSTVADPTVTIYTNPDWDIRTVYMHLVWAERGLLRLYRAIAAGGAGAPSDFDLDRYNNGQALETADVPWEDIPAQFEAARAETIAWVSTLSDDDLDRTGRHPFVGEDTLEQLIKVLYLHSNLHIKDIKARINHG